MSPLIIVASSDHLTFLSEIFGFHMEFVIIVSPCHHLSILVMKQLATCLTLQVEATGIDIELRGGAFKALPVKTCLGTILTQFFLHRKGWG